MAGNHPSTADPGGSPAGAASADESATSPPAASSRPTRASPESKESPGRPDQKQTSLSRGREAVKAPDNEEPEPVAEPDLPSDGKDEHGEAMIRDLPRNPQLSPPHGQSDGDRSHKSN